MAFRTGYAAKAEEFNQMFPISDSSMAGIGQITADQKASKRGYFEARNIYRSPTALGYALVRKTAFLCHLYIKTIILPRQARDKHRESSKRARFVAGEPHSGRRGG